MSVMNRNVILATSLLAGSDAGRKRAKEAERL
jgi:hypothetical protein